MDLSAGGIEVFIFQLANHTAVHSVAVVGAELLDIELDHSAANLFIGSEGNLDLAVLELRVGHHILCSTHYLCHAGLVVGAQQGGAVGGYKGLAAV